MSKLKPVLLALSMMLVAPAVVHASDITLVPAVKLQIGDQDHRGHYWDGGNWRDHDWWDHHYERYNNHWRARYEPHRKHHDDHREHRDDHRPGNHHNDRHDDDRGRHH